MVWNQIFGHTYYTLTDVVLDCSSSSDFKAFKNFWQRMFYLPLPDYSSLQYLWRHLIENRGGVVTKDLDIQTLSHISYMSGYSAGAVSAEER